MNILITDGDNRATLALTRALGREHCIIVGGKRDRTLASASRYCQSHLSYPDPITDETGFVEALHDAVRRYSVDLLIPVTDITTFIASENRHRLEAHCRLPLAPLETLRRAADKADIVRTAMDLGIPTPQTQFIENRAALPARLDIDFPLVVKPARSRIRVGNRWFATSVSYAFDRNELERTLVGIPEEAFPVLLQERIPGEGMGVFACYDRGKCIALFSHRRIREKPPSGGVSVLRESAPLDPIAADYATRLLDRIGWHGVAMVEFKRDERDGVPKVMEINGRFWGSLQLAIDAGLDFPGLLLQLGVRERIEPVSPYRAGVRSRWLLGDLDALLMLLFKSEERQRLAPSQRSRWKAVREFLCSGGPDTRLEILRRDDPRPFFYELKQWIRGRR